MLQDSNGYSTSKGNSTSKCNSLSQNVSVQESSIQVKTSKVHQRLKGKSLKLIKVIKEKKGSKVQRTTISLKKGNRSSTNKKILNRLMFELITAKYKKGYTPVDEDTLKLLNFESLSEDITIPNVVESVIRNHISPELKSSIHPDHEVAVESCLLFCSLIIKYGDNNPYTIMLSSQLSYLFGTVKYTAIINALSTPTDKPAIIECDGYYHHGSKGYGYRFTDHYFNKGKRRCKLKTKVAQYVRLKIMSKRIIKASRNPIALRIMQSYKHVTIPTIDQIKEEAQRLKGTVLKNGKILKILGKHSSNEFQKGKYTFVEESINLFKALTEGGFEIPKISSEKAGGRVVDTFTLMPSWIRALCTINGVPMSSCESDYKSLHPNLAYYMYDTTGETNFISGAAHQNIANSSELDLKDIKKCHLSFFNQEIWQMEKSPIHEFYQVYCPEFLSNIKSIKRLHGYKHISKDLFKFEVDLMTEVIKRLDPEISVIYVYDALYSDDPRVKDVMNQVAKDVGLKTYVG